MQFDMVVAAAKLYIETLFAGNAGGHGADHTLRVYRNAMAIAEGETCDPAIVALAAPTVPSALTISDVLTVEDVIYPTPIPPPKTEATTPHANAAALRLPINSSFPEKVFSIFSGC